VMLAIASPLRAQTGTLQSIRNDVNNGPPPGPSSSSSGATGLSAAPATSDDPAQNTNADDTELLWLAAEVVAIGGAVTSPIWLPRALSDDDYSRPAYLNQFPYDDTASPRETFPFAIRFDADYVDAFDNLDRINGHLLISTATRFELDTRAQYLSERLADGSLDKLWNGDCNVTFRFAQTDRAQVRAGLGINWLNDSTQTDLGFNFIYGADFFPAKPWVFSAVADAGTLGHARLFRFRTTVGAVYRSVEVYTGYEYTDIGSVHWNGLVSGLRLWF
jgi:hypothetical protein